MKVEMKTKKFRKEFKTISEALCKAHTEKKAVLVTQYDEFMCAFIPDCERLTIEITERGFQTIQLEFHMFDNKVLYNWEDCVFEIIDTENIIVNIMRD